MPQTYGGEGIGVPKMKNSPGKHIDGVDWAWFVLLSVSFGMFFVIKPFHDKVYEPVHSTIVTVAQIVYPMAIIMIPVWLGIPGLAVITVVLSNVIGAYRYSIEAKW